MRKPCGILTYLHDTDKFASACILRGGHSLRKVNVGTDLFSRYVVSPRFHMCCWIMRSAKRQPPARTKNPSSSEKALNLNHFTTSLAKRNASAKNVQMYQDTWGRLAWSLLQIHRLWELTTCPSPSAAILMISVPESQSLSDWVLMDPKAKGGFRRSVT